MQVPALTNTQTRACSSENLAVEEAKLLRFLDSLQHGTEAQEVTRARTTGGELSIDCFGAAGRSESDNRRIYLCFSISHVE